MQRKGGLRFFSQCNAMLARSQARSELRGHGGGEGGIACATKKTHGGQRLEAEGGEGMKEKESWVYRMGIPKGGGMCWPHM